MGYRVLFVCTANICRSPMAERLLAARLSAARDVHVGSAGTRALVGHPMDAASATVLQELGGDPTGHEARQLTAELVKDADLVLTATSAHRAEILREQPGAMRRAFTVREFARLASVEDVDVDLSVSERVAEIATRRGLAPAGNDDIGDPFGARIEIVRACGEQIKNTVDEIALVLS